MPVKCVRDESRVNDLLKVLEAFENTKIEIGILSSAGEKMLMIANVNEFGISIDVTPKMRGYLHSIGIHLKKTTTQIHIPERSFIRAGYEASKKDFQQKFSGLLQKVILGEMSVDSFFDFCGEYCVGKIREFLVDLRTPPNHPITAERKKSSNPLIDTGHLKDSISYRIIRK